MKKIKLIIVFGQLLFSRSCLSRVVPQLTHLPFGTHLAAAAGNPTFPIGGTVHSAALELKARPNVSVKHAVRRVARLCRAQTRCLLALGIGKTNFLCENRVHLIQIALKHYIKSFAIAYAFLRLVPRASDDGFGAVVGQGGAHLVVRVLPHVFPEHVPKHAANEHRHEHDEHDQEVLKRKEK